MASYQTPYFFALGRLLLAGLAWLGTSQTLPNREFVVETNGDDHHDGGAGTDTLNYERQALPVFVSLAQSTGFGEGVGMDTIVNIENVVGGQAADLLVGDDGINRLEGLAGDDNIWGLESADVMIGGPGADLLVGGAGNDRYVYRAGDGSDGIFEEAQGGDNDILEVVQPDADVQFSRFGDNLRIGINGAEFIVVWDQFAAAGSVRLEALVIGKARPILLGIEASIIDEPWYACLVPYFGDCPARPDDVSPSEIDLDTMSVSHH